MLLFLGNFTSLAAVLHFKRQLAAYFLQEFIPTILIVAISWVSFWIDERSVPARVSLGITTVLALTTLMFGIQTSMPRVGHVKAIDVFLLCSFFFVFSALVEYAIICTLSNSYSSRADVSLKQHSHGKVIPSEILDEKKNGKIAGDKNEMPNQDLAREQGEIQVNISFECCSTLNNKSICCRSSICIVLLLCLWEQQYFYRAARNPNLQVVISHTSHVFQPASQHFFGLPLRMNGMHRAQFDHVRFELPPSVKRNLSKAPALEQKRFAASIVVAHTL